MDLGFQHLDGKKREKKDSFWTGAERRQKITTYITTEDLEISNKSPLFGWSLNDVGMGEVEKKTNTKTPKKWKTNQSEKVTPIRLDKIS